MCVKFFSRELLIIQFIIIYEYVYSDIESGWNNEQHFIAFVTIFFQP